MSYQAKIFLVNLTPKELTPYKISHICCCTFNSRLKATEIIGQRKSFYEQRIPEPSYVKKETVDIDILVTSRNRDREIMQSIRITSRPPSKMGCETSGASPEEHLPKEYL